MRKALQKGEGPRTGRNLDSGHSGEVILVRRRQGVGTSRLVPGTRRRPRAPPQESGQGSLLVCGSQHPTQARAGMHHLAGG